MPDLLRELHCFLHRHNLRAHAIFCNMQLLFATLHPDLDISNIASIAVAMRRV